MEIQEAGRRLAVDWHRTRFENSGSYGKRKIADIVEDPEFKIRSDREERGRSAMSQNDWIYDWNLAGDCAIPPGTQVLLNDETLRDGLQNPSVHNPTIEEKIEILHFMEALGIHSVNIGLPGAGPRAKADVEALAREISDKRMRIQPNCAARTVETDIRPIAEISQRVGIAIEAATFLGSSPIRRLVEDWTVDHLEKTTERAVKFAVAEGLPVMYVTEDTVRTDPDTVERLYKTAIRSGARAIVLCDTVGHATPEGAFNLVKFVVERVVKPSGETIRVDWHGHRDRGLSIANSLAAVAAGARQIHGVALSLGERVGNTPMELLLVNLRLMGLVQNDLTYLRAYCEKIAKATHTIIPPNYPVFGRDAYRTATGVHAAAIVKALNRHNAALADSVYSGVPAHMFGLEQIVEVGPMSGKSNVLYWLARHKVPPTDDLVNRIFEAAKQSTHVFSDDELRALVGGSGTSA